MRITALSSRSEASNEFCRGDWLLSGAITLGALIGWFFEIPEAATSALVAVLAGGVILNVLKEELPEERRSRFLPFLAGAVAYAALLLAF